MPTLLRFVRHCGLALLWLTAASLVGATAQAAEPPIYIGTTAPLEPYQPLTYLGQYQSGSTVTFGVISDALGAGTIDWLHDDQPIPGANARSLTLTNLSAADRGNYRLRFTDAAGRRYSNTVVVNVLPPLPTVVDTGFVSQLPASFVVGGVTAFAEDGSFIVVSTDAATPPRRLAGDGSLVAGFNFPIEAGTILAGFPDGRLIVSKSPYLLAPDGSPLPFTLPTAFDATKPITSAAVLADGRFCLGQGTTIVRLLADGSVDTGFSFSAPTRDTTTDILGVDRQARLLVRGMRLSLVTSDYPPSWDVLYRLNRDGSLERELRWVGHAKGDYGRGVTLADDRVVLWSSYEGSPGWQVINADGSEAYGGVTNPSQATLTVDPRHADLYWSAPGAFSPPLIRRHLGPTSLEPDPQLFVGLPLGSMLPTYTCDPSGKLLLCTNTASWEGHATQNLARIRTDVPSPPLPAALAISGDTTPMRGSTVTLSTYQYAVYPEAFAYQWLALDGQPLPAETTSSTLVIPNVSIANFGRYQLRVSGAFGSVLTNVVELGLSPTNLPYLTNLSGRAVPGTGEDMMIAGVTTDRRDPVPLLFRGIGPGLKTLGVSDYLPNPALNLFDRSGAVVANNDNWGASPDRDTMRAAFARIGAFALADDSLDAALLKTANRQQFTVTLTNQSAGSGVGLLEVYRVPADYFSGALTNLSLRARTGASNGVAVAGFVLVDPQGFGRSARLLLRAIGPTLATQGIQHPLVDPVLTLYNVKGEVIRRVDNWGDDADPAALESTMKQVGAFDLPTGSKDAAVMIDLPAGVYTMHATGGEGVVLLEIYLVQ